MSDSTARLNLNIDAATAQAAVARLAPALEDVGRKASKAKEEHESFTKSLAEFGEKMFFIAEGAKKLGEAFEKTLELAKFSAELKNLEANVPIKALENMQRATEGTVDKARLLQFGMKALHGEFHLTEQGLGTVTAAAQKLHEEGFGETMQIADQLTESLRRGSSRGLREFGFALADTADKTANTNHILEKFHELAEKEISTNPALKQVEQVQAAWANLVTDFKVGLGSIAQTAMEWTLKLLDVMPKTRTQQRGESITSSARDYAREQVPGAIPQPGEEDYRPSAIILDDDLRLKTLQYQAAYARSIAEQSRIHAGAARVEEGRDWWAKTVSGQGPDIAGDREAKEGGSGGGGAGGATGRWVQGFNYELETPNRFELNHKSLYDVAIGENPGGLDLQSRLISKGGYGAGRPDPFGGNSGYDTSGNYDLSGGPNYTGQAPYETRLTGGQLENTGLAVLGGVAAGGADKVAELEKQKQLQDELKDRTTALGASFDVLSSGLSAAVDAAVSGSASIGEAFKKASATALKALAVEYGVRALGEGAMAIVSLASYDYGGAATHALAAAKMAAAAAAAGVGSSLLGGGGAGGGGGGGAASAPGAAAPNQNLVGTTNGVGQGGGTVIVNITGAITAGDYAKLGEVIEKGAAAGLQAGRTRAPTDVTMHFE